MYITDRHFSQHLTLCVCPPVAHTRDQVLGGVLRVQDTTIGPSTTLFFTGEQVPLEILTAL